MRKITSPHTFKTCYIAQIKKELGYQVKRAPNRKGTGRIVTAPDHLRGYIVNALEQFKDKDFTYKDIQMEAFNNYSLRSCESDTFFGIFKGGNKDIVQSIVDNKDIYYEL